jgi:guanosine-3',5'-bis(diphosphate) 3'-pyrophosphohydrolase
LTIDHSLFTIHHSPFFNIFQAMEDILEKIKDFADKAHGEQMRKYTPDRYIVHPVRVMNFCKEYTNDISILAAALLHDVLEDTQTTKGEIEKFLAALMDAQRTGKTTRLVEDLTDVYTKQNYPHWNRRERKQKEAERLSKADPDAQTVKYADIIDNSIEIVSHDRDFASVFLREGRAILEKIDKGNPQLRQRAIETVEQAIRELK